jgi:hypothetical protein
VEGFSKTLPALATGTFQPFKRKALGMNLLTFVFGEFVQDLAAPYSGPRWVERGVVQIDPTKICSVASFNDLERWTPKSCTIVLPTVSYTVAMSRDDVRMAWQSAQD